MIIIITIVVKIIIFIVLLFYAVVTPTLTPTPNPRTVPIIPGQECVIEIPKGNTGLGLSIVGGADTLLVSHTTGISLYRSITKFSELILKERVEINRENSSIDINSFPGSYCHS